MMTFITFLFVIWLLGFFYTLSFLYNLKLEGRDLWMCALLWPISLGAFYGKKKDRELLKQEIETVREEIKTQSNYSYGKYYILKVNDKNEILTTQAEVFDSYDEALNYLLTVMLKGKEVIRMESGTHLCTENDERHVIVFNISERGEMNVS